MTGRIQKCPIPNLSICDCWALAPLMKSCWTAQWAKDTHCSGRPGVGPQAVSPSQGRSQRYQRVRIWHVGAGLKTGGHMTEDASDISKQSSPSWQHKEKGTSVLWLHETELDNKQNKLGNRHSLGLLSPLWPTQTLTSVNHVFSIFHEKLWKFNDHW
jgi:hypothetical protein